MSRAETGPSSVGILWREKYETAEIFLVWIKLPFISVEIFIGFQHLVQTSQ